MKDLQDTIAPLEDYIMKNCLWQFNSRAWDRLKQNAGILGLATKILCDEELTLETPLDRCYWVDALCLARAYRERFPWFTTLPKDEIRRAMTALHERIDHLTVKGSLNEELTVPHY